MRCKCGHPKSDHKGIITDWFGRNVSNDACLAGTRFIQANGAYGERVGGDRCEQFRLSVMNTLRGSR